MSHATSATAARSVARLLNVIGSVALMSKSKVCRNRVSVRDPTSPPGRGRRTEIEFINGYMVNMARQFQLDAPINAAIVETVHAITSGRLTPNPGLLAQVLQTRTRK